MIVVTLAAGGAAQPLATERNVYDNTEVNHMRLIAAGRGIAVSDVWDNAIWAQIRQESCRGD